MESELRCSSVGLGRQNVGGWPRSEGEPSNAKSCPGD